MTASDTPTPNGNRQVCYETISELMNQLATAQERVRELESTRQALGLTVDALVDAGRLAKAREARLREALEKHIRMFGKVAGDDAVLADSPAQPDAQKGQVTK